MPDTDNGLAKVIDAAQRFADWRGSDRAVVVRPGFLPYHTAVAVVDSEGLPPDAEIIQYVFPERSDP